MNLGRHIRSGIAIPLPAEAPNAETAEEPADQASPATEEVTASVG